MKRIPLLDYDKWKSCNDDSFSLYDYIYSVLQNKSVVCDILYAILKLLSPEFIEFDGRVFLRENFQESQLMELKKQKHSGKELEYWTNLLSLDGLFGEDLYDLASIFADEMVFLWSSKLRHQFPEKEFDVRQIDDEGERYIVFTQLK